LLQNVDLVWATYDQLRSGDLRYLDPEGRRRIFGAFGLRADVDREGTVTLAGNFPEEINLSNLLGEHIDTSAMLPEARERYNRVFVASGNSRWRASRPSNRPSGGPKS
jgi:hypothetical protein